MPCPCSRPPTWLTDDVERTLPGLKIAYSVSKALHKLPWPTTDRSNPPRRKCLLVPALVQLHPCPDLAAVLTIRPLLKGVRASHSRLSPPVLPSPGQVAGLMFSRK
jgi:hypothetical protein